jgi:DNA segregation ATPase FtsK/SpoIIIE-like protein
MLITNLIKTYSQDDIKLALIDPKHVEFNSYKSLPHLFDSLARTPEDISTLLDNCLPQVGNSNTPIIILIDELAELTFNNDAMLKINSILNNDLNSNIYLIMASQRPITIPAEITF